MKRPTKKDILRQIVWDYNIPSEQLELVLEGEIDIAGHYTREMLFKKAVESYSWFAVLQVFTPEEVKALLTDNMIQQFRSPTLRKQYGFIQKRLQQTIPVAG